MVRINLIKDKIKAKSKNLPIATNDLIPIECMPSMINSPSNISKDDLSRWMKEFMSQTGMDLKFYKIHSARSALFNKALDRNIAIATVMVNIGWRQTKKMTELYSKCIEEYSLQEVVLDDLETEVGQNYSLNFLEVLCMVT